LDSVSYAEARDLAVAAARPLAAERVSLLAALGRVLAEDVMAERDDPAGPKSAMDGFALAAAQTQGAAPGAPAALAFRETVGAGHLARGRVEAGQAVRVMTGALLPPGADAVVKQEDTRPAGAGRFTVERPLAPGENVIPPGARMAAGARLLAAGTVVDDQALGVLAGLGRAAVAVHRRPRVALLALGDELVEPGQSLAPGQIYVSNLYALEALAARYGADTLRLGIARDDPAHIEALLRPCIKAAPDAEGCDLILTLGGSHKGDFDFAQAVQERLGARVLFSRVRINQGPSTRCAQAGTALLFGLPGTPGVSWCAFELLVRPALWGLAGRAQLEHPRLRARLTRALAFRTASHKAGRPGWDHFHPGRLRLDDDGSPEVAPVLGPHPGELPAAIQADCLIQAPTGVTALAEGDWVRVLWLLG
jgi:molybdopterin molybdotransferase